MDFKRFFKRRKAVESSALNEEQPVTVAFGPCCFCGSDIGATETDPCSVTVETVAGKWQVWYCHAECFKTRIAADTYMDLSAAHF